MNMTAAERDRMKFEMFYFPVHRYSLPLRKVDNFKTFVLKSSELNVWVF
jgi:hypothetical protein